MRDSAEGITIELFCRPRPNFLRGGAGRLFADSIDTTCRSTRARSIAARRMALLALGLRFYYHI